MSEKRPLLEVCNVDVLYGRIQALWDLSLEIREGEIVCLLGANGAGKSTAIKTIMGLIRPASGEVRFREQQIHHLGPHRLVARGLCLVPEEKHLFPYMTVLENLELGAYPKKARKNRARTLEWIYKLFPVLQIRRGQLAHTLSGGEQQMLAIGRGLMAAPTLIMLDEPSQGLAPLLVEEVFRTVGEINARGVSILLVEQNARHAPRLAHRAYVLENGRITGQGRAGDLLKDPVFRSAYLGV